MLTSDERPHIGSGPDEYSTWLIGSIAMLKDATEAERAERDQDADYAPIGSAIDAAEKALATLGGRQLSPDERGKEWSAIRDRTILAIRNVRHNIIKRANEAKQTERWMVEKWLREVNDGSILGESTADLQKVPTKGLVDYLHYLIQVGDLPRVQSVSTVFAARPDNQRYNVTFNKMLGQFTLSQCGSIGERIAKMYHIAEKMDVKIADLFSAHCKTKRSCAPSSQALARIEAPSIGALDIDALPPSEPGRAIQLLPRPADHQVSRPANSVMGAAPIMGEMQVGT
jgi:hypothetical protein